MSEGKSVYLFYFVTLQQQENDSLFCLITAFKDIHLINLIRTPKSCEQTKDHLLGHTHTCIIVGTAFGSREPAVD